jgi:hypothetical protein
MPSVRAYTGLSGAHRTVNNATTKNPLISYLLLLGGTGPPGGWHPTHHLTVGPRPTWPLAVG